MLRAVPAHAKVLELGSYNGWFSLELARRGAHVDAHDIAAGAIRIARTYYRTTRDSEQYAGTIAYHVTDLNTATFPNNSYDVVVIRNVLHHVVNVRVLLQEVYQAVKPGGMVIIDDALPCGTKEALLTGILLMVMPTDIPYRHKLQRVFRKGRILRRTQELVDAKDASPFEGVSGGESVAVVRELFAVESYTTFAAFIGTLTSQLRLPRLLMVPLLRCLNVIDQVLTSRGLLQGTVYFLAARKREGGSQRTPVRNARRNSD